MWLVDAYRLGKRSSIRRGFRVLVGGSGITHGRAMTNAANAEDGAANKQKLIGIPIGALGLNWPLAGTNEDCRDLQQISAVAARRRYRQQIHSRRTILDGRPGQPKSAPTETECT
jgi:hypothetical protein